MNPYVKMTIPRNHTQLWGKNHHYHSNKRNKTIQKSILIELVYKHFNHSKKDLHSMENLIEALVKLTYQNYGQSFQ